jgi:glycosyltransferase involved in cell wall biosynthesis
MQSKVSMVVPCYNKVKDIGAMLESVIAQKWDNLELILVNDGSNDGTREVISEYEPKLHARGYEVIVVDQRNAGCCAAVYAGLIKMTGDYFCLVDCDDFIEPEYVPTMAGWLDEHEDYEWAACSYRPYVFRDGKIEPQAITSTASMSNNKHLLERHILRKIITTSWVYMARVSYVKRCRLIENFCVERRKTYEPLFAVPLMLGDGKLKCFEEPLYRFNRFASDMYSFDTYEKVEKYYTDYSYLYNWSIERAELSQDEKNRLFALVKLGKAKDCLYHLNDMDSIVQAVSDRDQYINEVADHTTALIDDMFDPKPRFKPDVFKSKQYIEIMDILDELILKPENDNLASLSDGSRVIAYGALGKVAGSILPLLKGTILEPKLYWDLGAETDSGILGNVVTKPKFDELQKNDIILILPRSAEILQFVRQSCPGVRIIDTAFAREIIKRNRFSEIKLNCKFTY